MTQTTGTTSTATAHPIARFAERVHAVLDGLAGAPGWSMTAAEQRAVLVQLARAEARLTSLRLRVLAAADANDVGRVDASPSTAAWVAHATRQTRAAAHADVRLAKALESTCAATRDALAAGRLNEAQARAIVKAVDNLPTSLPEQDRARVDTHLVDLAAEHDAADLAWLGKKALEVIDPEAADARLAKQLAAEEREARRRTYLKLRDNGDGTMNGSFKIPSLHGAMLTKALEALVAPRRLDPERRRHPDGTAIARPELLGMGLCELIERYPLRRVPKAGGVNASVVVTMTLEQLLSGLGAAALDTGGHISAGEARRLACAAGVIPAVLGGRSEVLDLGRKRRFHSSAQRLALAVQDRRCTEEHCDRAASRCHAHHRQRWADGGSTSVAAGRLLCAWHHHRAHDSAYAMSELPAGGVRFTRRE